LLNLEKDGLRSCYERVAYAYRYSDPLEKWYGLVRFVSVEKRKKLKGDALKAQAFGEMAKMLRLFFRDAFGDELEPPNELGRTTIHRIPDVTAEDDPLRALELVVNDFGINPKPQAVLFIEGATEMTVVPSIFEEIYAAKPNVFAIELVSLGGVSNATGGKDSSFSALWRLIDYLHHHQTVAFVLLDNEGLAPKNVGIGLPRAHSIHFPDRRATRKNYVKLWKLSFEMDNFNDAELARALQEYSQGKANFSPADVKQCRESAKTVTKNKKVRTLDILYTERTGRNLNKPQFGRTLVSLMFNPGTKRKPEHRPIARFLDKLANLAALNHQPVTQAMWEYNQRSGHLGTLRPGAVSRRKDPFGQPLKKRRNPKST
jgi:phage tail protein X